MVKHYLDIKKLAEQLSIKPSTLYAWVEQGLIPHSKFGRLIRFEQEEIQAWLDSHRSEVQQPVKIQPRRACSTPLDTLIARAKREVYTPRRGKPDQDRARKEGNHGSV